MKHIYLIALAVLTSFSAYAQTTVKFQIDHKLKDQAFAFNQKATNNLDNEFNVKRLEYYLSAFTLTHDGGQITKASDVYILVDGGSTVDVELGSFNITTLESINFSVGVDPGVNNQDPTQWPSNHALAPKSPSMHWGWAAGYRFVALEGKTGSSMNTIFEIHALGNDNFFKISIPTKGSMDNGNLVIKLDADYTEALSNIDVSGGLVIHGETDQATRLLRNFTNTVFTSEEGNKNTLGITNTIPTIQSVLYPNPSNGRFFIELPEDISGNLELSVMNTTGETVLSQSLDNHSVNAFAIETRGVYVVTIKLNGMIVETKRLVVM